MTVQPLGQNPAPSSAPPLPVKDPHMVNNNGLTVLHTVQPRDSVAVGENLVKHGTYTREEVGGERVSATKQQQSSALLRRMAEKLIKEQYEKGNHLFQLLYGGKAVELDPMLRAPQISASFENNPEQLAQAEELVGRNGYYGVSQTSARILEFTKALSGGDNSKADIMRRSVEEAFRNLDAPIRESAITGVTFEAVSDGFDAWSAEKAAPVATSAVPIP